MIFVITQVVSSVYGAYNTVPTKKYPAIDEVEMAAYTESSFELHLKFSNNVGAIDETQEGRYNMAGYNDANLTKFHLYVAGDEGGTEVPITVTPHPETAKQTDESKYFYIFGTELDQNTTYTLVIDEDLYANMGNSLGVSYHVTICLAENPPVVEWGPDGELPTNTVVIDPLYMKSASIGDMSIENNQTDVSLTPSIVMTFSYNVSGPEMLSYNNGCFFLFQDASYVKVTVEAGETVNDFVMTPVEPLTEGTEYKIVVIKELSARNGSTMASPVNLYFTTLSSGETQEAPPEESATPDDIYFSDLSGHWAANEINTLTDYGILNGYSDATFRPDQSVSRAEMAKILVLAFDLQSDTDVAFPDTAGHWAQGYISTAAACGVSTGADGLYLPDEAITREQFVVMLVRAAGLTMPADAETTAFQDADTISSWAKDSTDITAALGLVSGYSDQTFRPQQALTRAEACKLLFGVLV
ncbi:MAG: S-layer homology domain-containing protein [Oscillospiraceae bacterium]|nr:S-layer homology domain-containing protein [Oscillospiraceae bacterium]